MKTLDLCLDSLHCSTAWKYIPGFIPAEGECKAIIYASLSAYACWVFNCHVTHITG